jgi:hydrogenase nickel incorporation protein HypA/HybF
MHEMSIAAALIDLTREHVPSDARVRVVRVRVGPMQAIEPEAMTFAWEAATSGTAMDGAELTLTCVPWSLHCRACDRRWEGGDWPVTCACGSADVDPTGSDDLTLLSIEIDDPDDQDPPNREAGPVMRQGV